MDRRRLTSALSVVSQVRGRSVVQIACPSASRSEPVTTRQHEQRQQHPSLPRPELGGRNVVIVDRDARRPEHADRHGRARPICGGCGARRSHGDGSTDREIARMAGSRSFACRLRDKRVRLRPVRVAFAWRATSLLTEFAPLRMVRPDARRTTSSASRSAPLRSARTRDSPLPEAVEHHAWTSTARRMFRCTSRSRSCSAWESSAQSLSAGCCT